MDAGAAADAMVARVRSRSWGLASAALDGDDVAVRLDHGDDPLAEDMLFEIGSITKTMTGVLLADCVVRGETSLDATLGDVLGPADAGAAAGVTLLGLATQHSGLPRLPPNLDLANVDVLDPWVAYDEPDLLAALSTIEPPAADPGHLYSNFGFMTLAVALGRIGGAPYGSLLQTRVFEPLGMATAACPPAPESCVLPGYADGRPIGWRSRQLPGSGGVGASVVDVCRWVRAHVDPASTVLGPAIELATTVHADGPPPMGLGWMHQGGGWWHNGGTGGFRSFAAFERTTRTGVVLLANSGDTAALDSAGFRTLTEMVRSRS